MKWEFDDDGFYDTNNIQRRFECWIFTYDEVIELNHSGDKKFLYHYATWSPSRIITGLSGNLDIGRDRYKEYTLKNEMYSEDLWNHPLVLKHTVLQKSFRKYWRNKKLDKILKSV